MKELYQWIQNLTGFFLFLSVAERLLPGKQYGKYLRLFSGMILVFIVLQPLTEGMHLEDTIAGYYESFLFQEPTDFFCTALSFIKYLHASSSFSTAFKSSTSFLMRSC